MHLELVTLIVRDYDEAIHFFVDVLEFELVEDSPSVTNDGRPKRWVVVRPPKSTTGLLLAQADGDSQLAVVGAQHGGRVGLFLRVDNFDASYARMQDAGVEFLGQPRHEDYGSVVVFKDLEGNKWDLLGPVPTQPEPPGALTVRRERPDDRAAVRAIHAAAFAADTPSVEGAVPIEVPLLDRLRTDGWIEELSWVAEIDGEIVGHNICTRATIDGTPCVGLGPIGVAPNLQRDGVGSALMRAMIGAADARGEPVIGLLGSPDYYRRFGFRPSIELGIEPPNPAWGPFFQALPLSAWDDSIGGQFEYAQPFRDMETD